MRKWVQKVVKSKKFFVVAAALMVAMQPLYGVFMAPNAQAASDATYVTQPLTAGDWSADRTSPSGGYGLESFAGRDTLEFGIDNTQASSSEGFYRTEGVKRSIGEADVIKADLYIDNDWLANDKDVRAGLWGVGRDNTDSISKYPIVEFTHTTNFTGWRIWNSDGSGWQNLATSYSTNSWSALALMRNKADATKTDVYINGTMVGQSVGEDTEYYSEMILNSYNYATTAEKNYDVHWSDIQTGEYTLEASYLRPTDSPLYVRPNDNPVRMKIDDEAQQFDKVQFSLYNYDLAGDTFDGHVKYLTVNRADCDLRQAGNYVLCDMKKASGWSALSAGAYAVKVTIHTAWSSTAVVTTGMSDYWSGAFVVDSQAPMVDSFVLEDPTSGYATTSVTVAATASDNNVVESVNFYMTTPREDGTCTGNGTKLVENRVWATDDDSKYRTTLSISTLLDGEYCMTAQARDQAKHNSGLQHTKVVVDNTAPTLLITTPDENGVFGGDDQIIVTSKLEDGLGLGNFFIDINSANVTILSEPDEVEELPEAETTETASAESAGLTIIAIYDAADFTDGEYVITARVTDKAGNETEATRTIFIDHSVPTTPGQGVTTPPTEEETDQAEDELSQLAQRLTQPFSTPRSFANTNGNDKVNQEVLGLDNGEENEVASGEQTVAAAPSEEGWKIFGVAWYWWLLLATVLGIATAWIMRRRNAGGDA